MRRVGTSNPLSNTRRVDAPATEMRVVLVLSHQFFAITLG